MPMRPRSETKSAEFKQRRRNSPLITHYSFTLSTTAHTFNRKIDVRSWHRAIPHFLPVSCSPFMFADLQPFAVILCVYLRTCARNESLQLRICRRKGEKDSTWNRFSRRLKRFSRYSLICCIQLARRTLLRRSFGAVNRFWVLLYLLCCEVKANQRRRSCLGRFMDTCAMCFLIRLEIQFDSLSPHRHCPQSRFIISWWTHAPQQFVSSCFLFFFFRSLASLLCISPLASQPPSIAYFDSLRMVSRLSANIWTEATIKNAFNTLSRWTTGTKYATFEAFDVRLPVEHSRCGSSCWFPASMLQRGVEEEEYGHLRVN